MQGSLTGFIAEAESAWVEAEVNVYDSRLLDRIAW